MASKRKLMLDFEEIQKRYVVAPETFFSEASIDDMLSKFIAYEERELDNNLYNTALIKSNLLMQSVKKYAKSGSSPFPFGNVSV